MTSTNASSGIQDGTSTSTTAVIDLTDNATNVTTFSTVGSKTITISLAARTGQRKTDITKTITVNLKPEFTTLTITSGTSNVVPSSALTWTVVWQGFAADVSDPITIKTINNSTGATIASFNFPSGLEEFGGLTASTTKTSTDVSSTLTVPATAGLTWKLRGSSTVAGISTIDSTTATNLTVHNATVYHSTLLSNDRAYSSYVDAADDKDNNNFSNSKTAHWGSPTGDSTAPAGTEWHTSATLSTDFDGTNNANAFVSTGVYIYRMVANDFVKTQKMTLTK